MVKLSEKTRGVIKDHIVDCLYSNYPKELSTFKIAMSIGRDKELVFVLLKDLRELGIIKEIKEDRRGFDYIGKRRRWGLKWEYVQALKAKGF